MYLIPMLESSGTRRTHRRISICKLGSAFDIYASCEAYSLVWQLPVPRSSLPDIIITSSEETRDTVRNGQPRPRHVLISSILRHGKTSKVHEHRFVCPISAAYLSCCSPGP